MGASAMVANGLIALIEDEMSLAERVRGGMGSAFSLPVVAYRALSELEQRLEGAPVQLVMLPLIDATVKSVEACADALTVLSQLVPGVPVVILGFTTDVEAARTAIRHGAKGYLPCTKDFDLAVQAVRFILAGGT